MEWCWAPVIALLESMDIAIVGEFALDIAIVICDESCCELSFRGQNGIFGAKANAARHARPFQLTYLTHFLNTVILWNSF